MLIPLAMGLLGPDGAELPTRLEERGREPGRDAGHRARRGARELSLCRCAGAAGAVAAARIFSAPVKLKDVPLDRLKFLAIHDTDPFARWEAGQQVATRVLLDRVEAYRQRRRHAAPLDPDLVAAMRRILADADRDPAFAAEALTLPSEAFLADQLAVVDVDAIHAARESARDELGRALSMELAAAYVALADAGPYRIDGAAIGRRALRNTCLAYLAAADAGEGRGTGQGAVRRASQHDRRAGGAERARRPRSARAPRGARALLRRLVARRAGDRQVVRATGSLVTAGTPDRVRELTRTLPSSAKTRTGCAR